MVQSQLAQLIAEQQRRVAACGQGGVWLSHTRLACLKARGVHADARGHVHAGCFLASAGPAEAEAWQPSHGASPCPGQPEPAHKQTLGRTGFGEVLQAIANAKAKRTGRKGAAAWRWLVETHLQKIVDASQSSIGELQGILGQQDVVDLFAEWEHTLMCLFKVMLSSCFSCLSTRSAQEPTRRWTAAQLQEYCSKDAELGDVVSTRQDRTPGEDVTLSLQELVLMCKHKRVIPDLLTESRLFQIFKIANLMGEQNEDDSSTTVCIPAPCVREHQSVANFTTRTPSVMVTVTPPPPGRSFGMMTHL